jgi:hypothetical protein
MKIYKFKATSICQARASAQAGGMVNLPMEGDPHGDYELQFKILRTNLFSERKP